MSSYIPFDRDISKHGKYLYTGKDAKLSSVYANASQTRLIHSYIASDIGSLLDIGCGDGSYTEEFTSLGSIQRILGIDPSKPAIDAANARCLNVPRLTFQNRDLEALLNEGEYFDLAVIRGVVHHATNPEDLIKDALKLARTVIISDPNGLNLILKIIEKTSSYHREHQEQSFSPRKFKKWISRSGGVIDFYKVGVLVPFFCPSFFAQILHWLEPVIENIPLVRNLLCGTQVFVVSQIQEI
jgi:2-polyprenyl-3-methyl-5-hydroxy-6-metoxy-1,4-benzoquinol methylase